MSKKDKKQSLREKIDEVYTGGLSDTLGNVMERVNTAMDGLMNGHNRSTSFVIRNTSIDSIEITKESFVKFLFELFDIDELNEYEKDCVQLWYTNKATFKSMLMAITVERQHKIDKLKSELDGERAEINAAHKAAKEKNDIAKKYNDENNSLHQQIKELRATIGNDGTVASLRDEAARLRHIFFLIEQIILDNGYLGGTPVDRLKKIGLILHPELPPVRTLGAGRIDVVGTIMSRIAASGDMTIKYNPDEMRKDLGMVKEDTLEYWHLVATKFNVVNESLAKRVMEMLKNENELKETIKYYEQVVNNYRVVHNTDKHLEDSLIGQAGTIKSMQAEITRAEDKINTLRETLKVASESNTGYRNANAALLQTNKDLGKKLEDKEAELGIVQKVLRGDTEQIESLKKQLQEAGAVNKKYHEDYKLLKGQFDAAKLAVNTLAEENKVIHDRKNYLEDSYHSLEVKLENVSDARNYFEAKLNEVTELNNAHYRELKELKKEKQSKQVDEVLTASAYLICSECKTKVGHTRNGMCDDCYVKVYETVQGAD